MDALERDVIAAIATGTGGALAVVRLSGPGALTLADSVFKPVGTRKPSRMEGYTAAYGHVIENGCKVDEAVLTVFRGPRSFTGEDMAEISCHGGGYLPGRVLAVCLTAGARPAGPGEFTRRAYLNGKMDLIQAEAVAALVFAEGEQAARLALSLRDDALGRQARQIADRLVEMAGRIAAWLDYPEEDMEPVDCGWFMEEAQKLLSRIEALLSGYTAGRLVRRGIDIAIVGRPNVGKSTLMNLLLAQERSIVTEIPGTTRDVVEGELELSGVRVRLSDTAGLRQSEDPVERIGVERARNRLAQCDLALVIFDGSDRLTDEDRELIGAAAARPALAVINKTDLPLSPDIDYIRRQIPGCLLLSAKSGQGISQLREAILRAVGLGELDPEAMLVAQERQRDCLDRSAQALRQALTATREGVSFDALAVLLEEALGPLLELTGKRVSETVVDELFSKFCVGK